MNWKPSEMRDLFDIDMPEEHSGSDVRSILVDNEQTRVMLRENARTAFDGSKPIAILGISQLWKGVGVVWTLLSEQSKENGFALSLGSSRFIRMMYVERGYWRLQATIIRGDEIARLWIVKLGFVYEGTMVAYGPDGQTHDMYARVRI